MSWSLLAFGIFAILVGILDLRSDVNDFSHMPRCVVGCLPGAEGILLANMFMYLCPFACIHGFVDSAGRKFEIEMWTTTIIIHILPWVLSRTQDVYGCTKL